MNWLVTKVKSESERLGFHVGLKRDQYFFSHRIHLQ